jgi:hypothetical protein
MIYVAVAYNAGHVNVGAGPKQGFRDGSGVYYGENFQRYLAMAHAIQVTPAPVAVPVPDTYTTSDTDYPGPRVDLGSLVSQIMTLLRGTRPNWEAQTTAAAQDQVQQLVKILNTLASASPDKLGPVNGALGQTIGGKSAIGIIGALIVQLLSAGGDTTLLGPIVKALGGASGLTGVGLPIFLAMAAWGVLGKLEKWSQSSGQPGKNG